MPGSQWKPCHAALLYVYYTIIPRNDWITSTLHLYLMYKNYCESYIESILDAIFSHDLRCFLCFSDVFSAILENKERLICCYAAEFSTISPVYLQSWKEGRVHITFLKLINNSSLLKQRKTQPWRRFGYLVLNSIDIDHFNYSTLLHSFYFDC